MSSSWSSMDDSLSSSLSSSQDESFYNDGGSDYTDLYGTEMTAAENLTVCDDQFPVEQLFYYNMPCRPDDIASVSS